MIKLRIDRVYDAWQRRYVWRLTYGPHWHHFIICDTHAEAIAAASALTNGYGMEATA